VSSFIARTGPPCSYLWPRIASVVAFFGQSIDSLLAFKTMYIAIELTNLIPQRQTFRPALFAECTMLHLDCKNPLLFVIRTRLKSHNLFNGPTKSGPFVVFPHFDYPFSQKRMLHHDYSLYLCIIDLCDQPQNQESVQMLLTSISKLVSLGLCLLFWELSSLEQLCNCLLE